MGQTKEERLKAVHARALERFDRAYASQKDIREQCLRDRRFVFVPGAQFEGDLEEQFANRPRFEINKIHQSVIRIFSEYRNNRVSVDFRPGDEDTSDDTAEFLDGAYRGDEQESGAQEAYDTAFEEGVAGGMGAWRLVNRYEDEEDDDSDRRRICIEPIPDADQSVFFDIDAKRYDKSDATHCFVISGMQAGDYSDEYGEDGSLLVSEWQQRRAVAEKAGGAITSFDKVAGIGVFDWFAPEIVYVAEYYEVEMTSETVNIYKSRVTDAEEKLKPKDYDTSEEFDQAEKDLTDQGFFLARTKKIKRRKVHKYVIDGARVLEDCGYIAGRNIPVIPYYAKRGFVQNVERLSGQTRLAIDLQRLYNMVCSLLAEISVRSPVSKPIFTPEQIAGHETMWAEDDQKRYPYLLVNQTLGTNGEPMPPQPVGYTKAPEIPPALAGLLQLIGADLQEILGSSDNAQEVVSNISAKAVELIQNRLDMQNFIYMDNFKNSMKRCGEVWLDMARELYDEEDRAMRTINADGTEEIKKLRQPADDNGKTVYTNDPSAGKFKVVADVGPSFTTRRDGTVRAITGMLQFVTDPSDVSALTNVAIQNLEGEGLQDVKDYFRRKGVAAGVIKPTEEEAKEMNDAKANEQPDAQSQFLLASAQKAQADAEKAAADTALTLQKIKESEANIAKLIAGIESGRIEQILKLAESMNPADAQGVPPGAAPKPQPPAAAA